MKKIIFLIAIAAAEITVNAQSKSVNNTAGGLATALTADEKLTLKELTITGEINSADVKILRIMTKTRKQRFGTAVEGNGVLEVLDMRDAKFIYDSKDYFYDDDNMEGFGTSPNSISGYMFIGSSTLKKVYPPKGTKSVGPYAFADCSNLELFDASDVAVFSSSCFSGCEQLAPVSLEKARSIGSSAFSRNLKITEVVINDNIIENGSGETSTFSGNAFAGCANIKSVKLGKGITYLDSYSFNNLANLESVDIQGDLKYLLPNSFNDCASLKSFTVNAASVPTTPNMSYATGPFNNLPATAVLYVPAGSENAYAAAKHWSNFKSVKAIGSGSTAIGEIDADNAATVDAVYTIDGKRLEQPAKGLNIIKMSDGTVRKVIVK